MPVVPKGDSDHRFLYGSGLLSRAHQNFTDEALRRLRHERRNNRCDVFWLQLLFGSLLDAAPLPEWSLKSVLMEPGAIALTRMLYWRSSSATE